jgi:hypothetical protein
VSGGNKASCKKESEMLVSEVAKLRQVNEADADKAMSIANAIIDGTFAAPSLLYYVPINAAVTGSHRIEAAKILVSIDADHGYDLGYSDIDMDVTDVTEYIDSYCEDADCTFDQIPFDYLKNIFSGTDIEDEVKENEEWSR